jgi:aspartokinase
MKTLPEVVDELIRNSPFIEESLAEGLINLSSLARKMHPEIEKKLGKKINIAAIIMALNRRPLALNIRISKQVKRFINNLGDITVRSNLIDCTFINSSTLREKQSRLLKILSADRDAFYAISQGVLETTIVLSSSYKNQLDKIFGKEKLVSITRDLSSLTVKLPKENTRISGVYYFIFQKVAWQGINIVEVISTTNEFTIVVDDENVDKAFSVLKNLSK